MAASGIELKSGPQLAQWHPTIQEYLQDVRQAIASNNLGAAQQSFAQLQKAISSSAPSAGAAALASRASQGIGALGQALDAGDLPGANQALDNLRQELQSRSAQDGQQTQIVTAPTLSAESTWSAQEDQSSEPASPNISLRV